MKFFVRNTQRVLVAALFISVPAVLSAQVATQTAAASTGRVVGRVIDSRTGEGLTGAGIQITGTTIGAMSSIDGRYSVNSVPTGTVTLTVRRLGYTPKTITGVIVGTGSPAEHDITLDPSTVVLEAQVVTAAVQRGTVNDALDRQRTSTAIVNSVTSEQITRSTDSDAAQAVRRVSGVTVQDGKYVFVRGLGERYTTATLNGAKIPSPEPEKKVVPLDMFPSSLVQSITTSKTFTPDQMGDFSGAQVNIKTREFPGRGQINYSNSFGINTAATGKTIFAAPTTGSEWIGLAGSERSLPALVRSAGNFGALNQTQINTAVGSFRNAWTPRLERGSPNYSMAVSAGGQGSIRGHDIGYIASTSYANTQEARVDEQRALAVPDGTGGTRPYNSFSGSSGTRSVLWGGLLNLSTTFGSRTRLEFNNTLNRTSDNDAKQMLGTRDDFSFEARRSALGFIERTIRSNQIRLEHALGARQQLDLSFTSSGVTRLEPDRSEIEYVREQHPQTGAFLPFALFSYNPDGARRTFGDLTENNLSGSADYRLGFGDEGMETVLKLGGAFRGTDRVAINTSYSLLGYGLNRAAREAPAEEIFDGRYVTSATNVFTPVLNSTGGSYTADDRIGAGYAMLERPFSSKLRLIGGARFEGADLHVFSTSTSGERVTSQLVTNDVLPALIANVALSSRQSLRLSASQTVSRPEYRELSPITYRDVIEQRDIFGNPKLRRALIQNYDVRWEMYPDAGEVVSVGLFAKKFKDPVERVDVATSGASQLSFVNADAATNYGVEVDLRKRLGSFLSPFTVFTNATVMRSEIDISSDQLSALTNKKRAMVGQAPFVVNAGFTYANESGRASSTLLYNIVGKRITAAGTTPLPDTYELPRHILDLSMQLPLFNTISAKLDAKNLLDAPYHVEQGSVIREKYRTGRVFTLGLRWQR